MLVEARGQGVDVRWWRDGRRRSGRFLAQDKVVGEHDPVAGLDGPDLVTAVGVERDERDRVRFRLVGRGLVAVLDDQGPTGERRRQGHHEGPDHAVGLLGVLVGDEELPRCVHQHGVQLGVEFAPCPQAEISVQAFECGLQRLVPPPFVDLHVARGDLPGVAHARVDQCAFSSPVPCGPAERAQLAGLGGGHGQIQPSESAHLDVQVAGGCRPLGAERTGSRHLAKGNGETISCRGAHRRCSRETKGQEPTMPAMLATGPRPARRGTTGQPGRPPADVWWCGVWSAQPSPMPAMVFAGVNSVVLAAWWWLLRVRRLLGVVRTGRERSPRCRLVPGRVVSTARVPTG